MLWCERFDPIEREDQLERHRLLGPERAVVVEGGDALACRYEVGSAFSGDAADELHDRAPRRTVVPRWEYRGCGGTGLRGRRRDRRRRGGWGRVDRVAPAGAGRRGAG